MPLHARGRGLGVRRGWLATSPSPAVRPRRHVPVTGLPVLSLGPDVWFLGMTDPDHPLSLPTGLEMTSVWRSFDGWPIDRLLTSECGAGISSARRTARPGTVLSPIEERYGLGQGRSFPRSRDAANRCDGSASIGTPVALAIFPPEALRGSVGRAGGGRDGPLCCSLMKSSSWPSSTPTSPLKAADSSPEHLLDYVGEGPRNTRVALAGIAGRRSAMVLGQRVLRQTATEPVLAVLADNRLAGPRSEFGRRSGSGALVGDKAMEDAIDEAAKAVGST